jgi:hypothetical protein
MLPLRTNSYTASNLFHQNARSPYLS